MRSGAVEQLAGAMVGQESAGPLAAILLRLARFLGGDPSIPVAVTSTSTTNTQGLPDDVRMESAVLAVGGAGISYRVDGGDPANGGGIPVVAGSTLTLTGLPTWRAFRFVSLSAAAGTVTGCTFT